LETPTGMFGRLKLVLSKLSVTTVVSNALQEIVARIVASHLSANACCEAIASTAANSGAVSVSKMILTGKCF